MGKQHIVKEGDSISRIAFENGFFPNTIWEHPENTQLRIDRAVGTMLQEGDVVFIPDRRIKILDKPTEAEHTFRIKGVPEKMKIRFLNERLEPRKDCRYVVNVDGTLQDGKTDSDGFVSIYIPPDAINAKLTIFEDSFENEYVLKIGYLEPITELFGVRTRLAHLGYSISGLEESEEQLRDAISSFQKDFNIEPTGELDEQTRKIIKEQYGS